MMSKVNPISSETSDIELYDFDKTNERNKGKAKVTVHSSNDAILSEQHSCNPCPNSYGPAPSSPRFLSPITSPAYFIPTAGSPSSSASASPSVTSSSFLYPNSNIAVRKASNSSSITSISAQSTPTSPVAPHRPR